MMIEFKLIRTFDLFKNKGGKLDPVLDVTAKENVEIETVGINR